MTNFIQDYIDMSRLFDGMLFALGIFAAWLLAVISASIIRSFGAAGGGSLVFVGKYILGRRQYAKGDQSNIVNVTLNTLRNGKLSIDTLVGDKLLQEVWPNVYHWSKLKAAAKRCTEDDPVIKFIVNGKRNDYRHTYDPLISMIAERCSNNGSIDLALGAPVTEHRFVIALTFEVLNNIRSRHFRVMMIAENELLAMADGPVLVERPEHLGRIKTIKNIAQQYKSNPDFFGVVKVWRPHTDVGTLHN